MGEAMDKFRMKIQAFPPKFGYEKPPDWEILITAAVLELVNEFKNHYHEHGEMSGNTSLPRID